MKDRRPRKLKKVLKRRFAVKQSYKILQCGILTAQACAQTAIIYSTPIESPADIPLKSLRVVGIVKDAAFSIQSIMNEPPKNWREA